MNLKSTLVSPGPPPPPASWSSAQKVAYTGHPSYPPAVTRPYPSPITPYFAESSIHPAAPGSQSGTSKVLHPLALGVSSLLHRRTIDPTGVTPVSQPQRDPLLWHKRLLAASASSFPLPPSQRQASYPLPGQPWGQTYSRRSLPQDVRYFHIQLALPCRQGGSSTSPALPPTPHLPFLYSQPPPSPKAARR